MHLAAAKALFQEHTRNLSPALARRRGWVIHLIEFPIIDCAFTALERTPLRLRLRCDNWNDCPPAVSLHAADGFKSYGAPGQSDRSISSRAASHHSATVCLHAWGAGVPHTHVSC